MFNRLWLLFAQTVTILLAAWFIVATLKPQWVSSPNQNLLERVTLKEGLYDSSSLSPGSYHEAVKKSMPAVVNIFTNKNISKPKTKKRNSSSDPLFKFFFGDEPPGEEPKSSLGSGVLVSPEGVILTNHHVISDADEVEVSLVDGRKFTAKIIGSDPETDIAVLKINASSLPTPITFGKIESVHVGDVVLAIGNPFGVGQTVTSGIVSALGRDHVGINTFENFIQTDLDKPYANKMSQDRVDYIRKTNYLDVNPYWFQEHFSGVAKEFLSEVMVALKSADWYDESDAQTDYFNTAYYVDINIGKWNTPYIVG